MSSAVALRWLLSPVLLAAWTQPAQRPPHYYDSVEVVCIGIDEYFSPAVPRLGQAAADARNLARALEEHFNFPTAKLLLNKAGTRRAILDTIDEIGHRHKPPEVLLLYFACHGAAWETISKDNLPMRVGFLVPHDAQIDLKDLSRPKLWAEEAIDMKDLIGRLERLPCKHVVLIADTCCSGFLTKYRGGLNSQEIITLIGQPSRTVLAATTQQEAAKEGIFTRELTKILAACAKDQEPLSMTDVFQKLRTTVAEQAGGVKTMTPQLSHVGVGDGEFVFMPKTLAGAEVDRLKDAVAAARKGASIDRAGLPAFRGLLERQQRLLGRRSTLAMVIAALEAPDYRYATDAASEAQRWEEMRRGFQDNTRFDDIWAIAGLHLCLARGLGGAVDAVEAHRWAKQALQFDRPAGVGHFCLGRCYEFGLGVPHNVLTAQRLYAQSSQLGFALGHWALANMLLQAAPQADDVRRALGLLEKARTGGVSSAATDLGRLYAGLTSGKSVEQDTAKGAQLLEEGAQRGDVKAQFLLASLLIQGRDRVKADKNKGLDWLRRAADRGHAPAQALLARAYCYAPQDKESLGLQRDYRAALTRAEMAARQGSPHGHLVVAQLLKEGLAGKHDWTLARNHLEKAAADGLPEAIWMQAFCIMRRECGYTLDATRSVDVYLRALAIDPQLEFLETPFYLEPRPIGLPATTLRTLRAADRSQRLHIVLQAVIQDVIQRVGNMRE